MKRNKAPISEAERARIRVGRQRAGAVVVVGLVLALAIYFGEQLLHLEEARNNEVHIPMRGLEYYRPMENRNEEIAALQTRLSDGDDAPAVIYGLVDAYDAGKRLGDGVAFFRKAAGMHPDSPAPHLGEGEIYLLTHDFEAAETSFTTALEKRPDWLPALKGLASARLNQKATDQAEVILEKAMNLGRAQDDPLLGDILGNLSAVRFMKRNIKSAFELRREAMELHAGTGDKDALAVDHYNLAQLHMAMQDNAAARDSLRESMALARESGDKIQ
ncbi:hypothetical protein JW905_14220, partial [bacterium]|nr:hypothetical protein [candidate division CSSED10-310 bacterium]